MPHCYYKEKNHNIKTQIKARRKKKYAEDAFPPQNRRKNKTAGTRRSATSKKEGNKIWAGNHPRYGYAKRPAGFPAGRFPAVAGASRGADSCATRNGAQARPAAMKKRTLTAEREDLLFLRITAGYENGSGRFRLRTHYFFEGEETPLLRCRRPFLRRNGRGPRPPVGSPLAAKRPWPFRGEAWKGVPAVPPQTLSSSPKPARDILADKDRRFYNMKLCFVFPHSSPQKTSS